MTRNQLIKLAALAAAPLALASAGRADVATFAAPSLDRWNYPFNASPGTRESASTFGAVGTAGGFDDRDAQTILGFQTAGQVPAGLGAGSYRINALTVTATQINVPGGYAYDPTYDSIQTYGDAPAVADADAGRPVELYGVGFRNGFARLGYGADASPPAFREGTAFAPGNPTAEGVRNAFALGFDAAGVGRDVSNNVSGGFESNPWAVGQTALAPGAAVPADTTFTFALDVADPAVAAYLAGGLDAGSLGFTLSSLHPATFGGAVQYPQFYLRENNNTAAARPATLTVDFTVVPEPASLGLLGLAGLATLSRRRRA